MNPQVAEAAGQQTSYSANDINYEPLRAMDHAFRKLYKASFGGHGVIVNTIIILAAAGLLFAGGLGIYVFVLWFVIMGFQLTKYRNQAWQNFAAVNDWPLDVTTSVLEFIPPSLQAGHNQNFSPIIQAQLGALSCDLFTYRYTIGYGKSQQTFVFTMARTELARSLPHLILFSKKSHARVDNDLPNHEKLQLEGDFNNYFTLQIEKGKEVDVLSILTPEVMQILVNYSQAEDVEILGNNLYFILCNDKRDVKDVQQLIQSVEQLAGRINQNIALTNPATLP